jgi:hypothetical protein
LAPIKIATNDRIRGPRASAFSLAADLPSDAVSRDETKPNETKQLDLRQADSVVYQVHRLMSPVPAGCFHGVEEIATD